MDILDTALFEYAKLHPITKGVLCLVRSKLERQLLFFKSKEANTKAAFLYWYPSLNSGLPIVHKPDEIHQSIYLFHDMAHTCLYDPLPDSDKRTYILGKMLGEVLAQLIADGIFASILKSSYNQEYNYGKRYYIQMYSLLQNYSFEQIAIAIAYFAIFNNRTHLLQLCQNAKAKKWCHIYCNLYYKMFSADLWWNNEIYKQFEGQIFEYDPTLCYRNNQKRCFTTIEAVVEHNVSLLQSITEKDGGDGIKLATQLSKGSAFVYDFVQVNYKSTIDEQLLAAIREELV